MLQPVRTYEQAIEYVFGRINFEHAQPGSISRRSFKLERMRRLLELLGNPQNRLKAVHIAGTKGKGSTATLIAEMLNAADYRVGLFTSPHVSAFEERMRVNGHTPQRDHIVDLVNRVAGPAEVLEESPSRMIPTFFEIATAMAWLYFLDLQVQVVVLEVGLGGRLDSTNICRPEVTVITNISREHIALLGTTHAQIATEKAGIVKPGVPVISGVTNQEAMSVIAETCRRRDARLFHIGRELHFRYSAAPQQARREGVEENRDRSTGSADVTTHRRAWPNVPLPLVGEHQAANATIAIGVLDVLAERGWNIPAQAVYTGMANVRCPVRIETLCELPTVIVDAAHNWASVNALIKTLSTGFPARRRILVFAASKDKDLGGMVRLLLPHFDTIILTQYMNNPRAVAVETLHRIVQSFSEGPIHVAPNPKNALELARGTATADDLICITGSFFLAAEMRELIVNERRLTVGGKDTNGPLMTERLCS